MKTFGIPKLAIVHLTNEDVIRSSITCEGNICNNYFCDDCVECNGNYNCFSFVCHDYVQP